MTGHKELLRILKERNRERKRKRAKLIYGVLLKLKNRVPEEYRNRIIIFGSWAWGSPGEWSDIDVAVDDRGMSSRESLKLLARVSVEGYEDCEDVIFLTEAPENLRRRILQKGISIDEALKAVGKFLEGEG